MGGDGWWIGLHNHFCVSLNYSVEVVFFKLHIYLPIYISTSMYLYKAVSTKVVKLTKSQYNYTEFMQHASLILSTCNMQVLS